MTVKDVKEQVEALHKYMEEIFQLQLYLSGKMKSLSEKEAAELKTKIEFGAGLNEDLFFTLGFAANVMREEADRYTRRINETEVQGL